MFWQEMYLSIKSTRKSKFTYIDMSTMNWILRNNQTMVASVSTLETTFPRVLQEKGRALQSVRAGVWPSRAQRRVFRRSFESLDLLLFPVLRLSVSASFCCDSAVSSGHHCIGFACRTGGTEVSQVRQTDRQAGWQGDRLPVDKRETQSLHGRLAAPLQSSS